MNRVKLIECPRDAMQGIKEFIPTKIKAEYINKLLKVGFDTIDLGSFVSPKAVPQMSDTSELLRSISFKENKSNILVIIANTRGAKEAVTFEDIDFLGFPFSISETFQLKNTNSGIMESLERLKIINDIAIKANKKVIAYLSMGFGNPYQDPWDISIVHEWIDKLVNIGIDTIALSDTIGISNENKIYQVFSSLIGEYPHIEFGAHFHTTADTWKEKIDAALKSGCKRFDGAIQGFGGCPMTGYELVGNMPTEKIVDYFSDRSLINDIDRDALKDSLDYSAQVFNKIRN